MHDSEFTHDHAPDALNPRRALLAGLGGLAAGALLAGKANAGPLTPPPGPITSTPGPEPRTPINAQNTPGDATNSFRITQPGSYYLESNIIGEVGKHGIRITVPNVTIDLNGFALLGPGGEGQFRGIIGAGGVQNVTIRNGTVSNWPSDGIGLPDTGGIGSNSLIENVIARANGRYGINTLNNPIVRSCLAEANANDGIRTPNEGLIIGCATKGNGGSGISTGSSATIADCVAIANFGAGIRALSGNSLIQACHARSNALEGIVSGQSSTVTRCVASLNTIGISVGSNCFVTGNTCRSNSGDGGAGIRVTSTGNRIEDNNCINNAVGIFVSSSGNFIARNTCRNNTVNWSIASSNKCFVVLGVNASSFNGDSGGTSPGSTNPNANYTY